MPYNSDSGKSPVNPLFSILIAVFTAGFGFGIVLPISSVILERLHISTPLIGLTATAMFVGLAMGAPLVARSIELWGVQRTLSAGLFFAGLSMIALAWWISLPAWFALRFLMGVAFAAVFTSCETLINRISTEFDRGRNLGIYAFAFSLSLMIGPLGLWLLNFGIWAPFVVAGVVCFIAAFLVFSTIPSVQEEPSDFNFDLSFIGRIWLSVSTMLMAGFMEGALIALIPVYTLRQGFSPVQTGILLFAFMLGHGGLPPIIGILGDRLGLKKVLSYAYGLGTMCFILIPFFPAEMSLMIMLALAGASVGALYPLAVGLLANVLTSSELPRGNAMTTFCYGLGSIFGPFIPALIMHVTVPKSLFVVSAVLYSLFLVIIMTSKE